MQSGLKSIDVYTGIGVSVCLCVCVCMCMRFSLPVGRLTVLSGFSSIFLLSDEIFVINEIPAAEKIASKPMSSLKMSSVPAVYLYRKEVGRFPSGL